MRKTATVRTGPGPGSARKMFAQLLEIEQADAAAVRLDRALARQVMKSARDRLSAQRQCGRKLFLCYFERRLVALRRLMQEEMTDLLNSLPSGQFPKTL